MNALSEHLFFLAWRAVHSQAAAEVLRDLWRLPEAQRDVHLDAASLFDEWVADVYIVGELVKHVKEQEEKEFRWRLAFDIPTHSCLVVLNMVRPAESPFVGCAKVTIEKYKPAYGRVVEIKAASVHKNTTLHTILRHLLSADMLRYEFFTSWSENAHWLRDVVDSLESAELIRLPEVQLETYGPKGRTPASLTYAAYYAMDKLYGEWGLEDKACGLGLPRWHGNGKFCDEPVAEEAISVPPSYATVWMIPLVVSLLLSRIWNVLFGYRAERCRM